MSRDDQMEARIEGISPGGDGNMPGADGHAGEDGRDSVITCGDDHLDRPLELWVDPTRLDDNNGDGSLFLSTVRLLGEPHHFTLLRVRSDPHEGMVAANPEHEAEYRRLHWLYEGPYVTVEVPGHQGNYVAYLHPYGSPPW